MKLIANVTVIAILCILLGGASIPVAFIVTRNPFVVWFGNALGSVLSVLLIIYVANAITGGGKQDPKKRNFITKKIVNFIEDGHKNKTVVKSRNMINKYGMRIFSLVCPIFPGVLVATVAVYLFDLDKKQYLRWMPVGLVLLSGIYVFAFWLTFLK